MKTTHVRAYIRKCQRQIDQRLTRLETKTKKIQEATPTIPPPPLTAGENTLPVQVSLIIPSTTKQNQPITDDEYNARIQKEKLYFDKHFGGDTSTQEVGSYAIGNKIINEKGTIITSSMSRDTYRKHRRSIANHAEKQRKQWKQHTLLLTIEGRTYITPRQNPRKGWDTDDKINKPILVT